MTTIALLAGREPSLRYSLYRGYADAVWAIGATPIVLVPPLDDDGVGRYVDAVLACDGVCATGGGDLAIEPIDGLMDPDIRRDIAEVEAVRKAAAASMPVLGICRGIQLLAVAFGGTLYRDLPSAGLTGHWEEERQHEPVHAITAQPGSTAAAVLGSVTEVNSIHHQGVLDPGPNLRATAWSDDGLVEAVEAPGVLGLQWHPERLWTGDDRHLGPFKWLAAA